MPDNNVLPSSYLPKAFLDILVESENWLLLESEIHKYCQKVMEVVFFLVLDKSSKEKSIEVSLLLADDTRLRNLNNKFRYKDKVTNVLSFPFRSIDINNINDTLYSSDHLFLGDIAISYSRVCYERLNQKQTFIEYSYYMFLHGFLHLLGYDHTTDRDAQIMEKLEKEVMIVMRSQCI